LLIVAALAFGVIAVRYPFQYDHLLNARDGVLRRLHDALTAHGSPTALTVALWGTITMLALPTLFRTMSRRWAIASLLVLGVLGSARGGCERRARQQRRTERRAGVPRVGPE